MARRLRIFLCGTFTDFHSERRAILEGIASPGHRLVSMEWFGAHPDTPIEVCLAQVRECDVLIVIVGHRYGSYAPKKNRSFSELEYREGYNYGKPCLVFFLDKDALVHPDHVESSSKKKKKLKKWKKKLRARHTVACFKSVDSLVKQVKIGLQRVQEENGPFTPIGAGFSPTESIADQVSQLADEAMQNGIDVTTLLSAFHEVIDRIQSHGDELTAPARLIAHDERAGIADMIYHHSTVIPTALLHFLHRLGRPIGSSHLRLRESHSVELLMRLIGETRKVGKQEDNRSTLEKIQKQLTGPPSEEDSLEGRPFIGGPFLPVSSLASSINLIQPTSREDLTRIAFLEGVAAIILAFLQMSPYSEIPSEPPPPKQIKEQRRDGGSAIDPG